MARSPARAATVVAILAVTIGLTGCTLFSAAGGSEAGGNAVVSAAQAKKLMSATDYPSGFTSSAEQSSLTASGQRDSAKQNWETQVKGSPEACRSYFYVGFLVTPSESAAAQKNDIESLAVLTSSANTQTFLLVQARVFSSTNSAQAFIAAAKAATAACSSGYKLGGTPPNWTTTAIHGSAVQSLAHGGAVAAVQFVEDVQATGIAEGYRSTLMRRGNVVVETTYQVGSGDAVDFSTADTLNGIIASRLAALS